VRSEIGVPSIARPNKELVVYALYVLGGESRSIHTEDIAIKCFELYPSAFSWVKYPQYPDKDIVRVALTDARKAEHGALVVGRTGKRRTSAVKGEHASVDDGWKLTSEGLSWVRTNAEALESFAGHETVKTHRQRLLKQLQRVRDHSLFADFTACPSTFNPSIGNIADLLRCRVDAEPEIWQARFDKIRSQSDAAGQRDVAEFISKCAEAYSRQR
jgi:hypothetical protein